MKARLSLTAILAATFPVAAAAQTAVQGRNAGAILQQHYDAAERFQRQGNLPEAERQYRLFVADALAELAVGEVNLGAYAKAAPYFDAALQLEPNSPQLRLDYARAAMDGGDLDHAQNLARELVTEEAGNPKGLAQAHEVLGRTLLRMNKDQEARSELEAATELDPSFSNQYNLAIACLDMDDEKCAERLFSTMQAAYGDTPPIHMDFGRAWGESDFQPRAEEEFKKVIAEDPRFPEAHYCLAAVYLEENEPSKIPLAKKNLEEELAISPRDFLTYAALGKLAANEQKDTEAAKYLNQAIALNPESPDAYLYLGQMQYNAGQYAPAERNLRQAIRLTTDPSRNHYQIQKAYYLLGRILAREGKQEEAAAEMKLAQAYLQTNFSRDKSRLSGFLGQGGSGMGGADSTVALKDSAAEEPANADPAAARALAAFQKQVAPALADSYNNLGAITATQRDYATAATYFQSAAEWNPALPGLNYNWGRAAFAAGRFGDAILPLSSYLRGHAADKGIREALGVSQFMIRDYKGCVATLQPIAPGPDANPQIAFAYADSLLQTGQAGEGTRRLASLEKEHPEIGAVHFALGEAFLEEGAARQAIPELESAVRLSPQNPDYHRELARAYRAEGRTADADRETRTYNSLQPPASNAAGPPLPN